MDKRISGHAALYGSEAVIAGLFRETILPGAFTAAIGRDDVRCLFNHSPDYVLGRTKSGTLTLSEDARGLRYDVVLPDTVWARDLYTSIQRQDVSQSSFSFVATQESWVQGSLPLRQIHDVQLFDVSPVAFPAYEATTVSARGDSLELRGAGSETRSTIAENLAVLRRLRLLAAAPSACVRCRVGTASRVVGQMQGRRMCFSEVCQPCGERMHLDRRARILRPDDRSRQKLRELELRERELQLLRRDDRSIQAKRRYLELCEREMQLL